MISSEAQQIDQLIEIWDAAYRRDKKATIVDFRALADGAVAPDRYTHLIHSYPAKLLPQIPHLFLQSTVLTAGKAKASIADPFCGTGTVLLEAVLKGHEAIGADSNPLARLIARVKLTPIPKQSILNSLARINNRLCTVSNTSPPPVVNIHNWYSKSGVRELAKLRTAIATLRSERLRNFMQVCFSACVRKLSLADPRLSVPVKINLARKLKYGPHYRQLRDHLERVMQPDVSAVFGAIVDKNATRANKLHQTLVHDPTFRLFEDARSLHNEIPRASVDLIITSPPYLGAQKYIRASSLSLGWLDMAYDGELRPLERKTIGREHFSSFELGSITSSGIREADQLLSTVRQQDPLRAHIGWTYLSEMEHALKSMHCVLRKAGTLLMVTGPNSICGHHFDTPSFLEVLAHRVGFVTRFKLIDQIRSRGLMIKRNKTASIIVSEWVLCFTKAR
jgi:hypothetical protein